MRRTQKTEHKKVKQLVGLSVSVNELLKVEKPAFHYGFSLNKLFAINKPHLSAYLIRLRVTPSDSVCSFCIIFSYSFYGMLKMRRTQKAEYKKANEAKFA